MYKKNIAYGTIGEKEFFEPPIMEIRWIVLEI